jgi:hypothetical protein
VRKLHFTVALAFFCFVSADLQAQVRTQAQSAEELALRRKFWTSVRDGAQSLTDYLLTKTEASHRAGWRQFARADSVATQLRSCCASSAGSEIQDFQKLTREPIWMERISLVGMRQTARQGETVQIIHEGRSARLSKAEMPTLTFLTAIKMKAAKTLTGLHTPGAELEAPRPALRDQSPAITSDSVRLRRRQEMWARYQPRISEAKRAWSEAPDQALLYARVAGQDSLVIVPSQESWPAGAEIRYLLLRDRQGRPLAMAIVPDSEERASDVKYQYIFDERGRTIFFEKEATVLNAGCTPSLYQMENFVYDNDFSRMGSGKVFKNAEGQAISGEGCILHTFRLGPAPSFYQTVLGRSELAPDPSTERRN